MVSHQLQIICRRQSAGTSADDCYFFTGALRFLRHRNRVGSGIVHCHTLQAADIDGTIDHVAAASCLTGMLTDQGTGGGERIVLADQLHGICITPFLHQCYVTGDIHTCGAQRHTGNRLGNMAGTFSAMFNVVDIILTEAFQSGQYHMGRLVTDGTVSGVHNVGSGIPDQIQCLQGGFACQYILHQVLQLPQSHTAGHTFTTGLGMTHFQKRKLQVHRT